MTLPLFPFVQRRIGSLYQAAKRTIGQWTRPKSHQLVFDAVADLMRPKSELVLENAFFAPAVDIPATTEKATNPDGARPGDDGALGQ